MTYLLACLLFVVSLLLPQQIFSADYGSVTGGQINEALNNTPHIRFLPPNPLYYMIRAKEPLGRFFIASAVERAQYDFMIAGKRLKEAYTLTEGGKTDRAEDLLTDYDRGLTRAVEQFNKARLQNMEVVPTVDLILSDMYYHETLIIYLNSKDHGSTFDAANTSFVRFTDDIDKIKPGVKGRFKLTKESF